MKAIIHFKDSAKVPSVTIENLMAIKAVVVYDNGRLRNKSYNEEKIIFTLLHRLKMNPTPLRVQPL